MELPTIMGTQGELRKKGSIVRHHHNASYLMILIREPRVKIRMARFEWSYFFSMIKTILASILVSFALADDCAELCRADSNRCVRSSWCKGDPSRGSCHNYFYDSEDKSGSFHYHVHGLTSVYPVLCREARSLISRVPTTLVATTAHPSRRHVVPVTVVDPITTSTSALRTTPGSSTRITCAELCQSLDACRSSRRGSYCKSNGTCTGLFFRTSERREVCYHSSGSDCPDDHPVRCDTSSNIADVALGVSTTVLPSRVSAVHTSSSAVPRPTPSSISVATRIERPTSSSLGIHVQGRRFRSVMGEFGVVIAFGSPYIRLEFTYRGARTVIEDLEYAVEGNFVHLHRGAALSILIEAVESIGTSISHHRHSAHHVTIHIVPTGTLQNHATYVIVRLGDLPPVTCTEF